MPRPQRHRSHALAVLSVLACALAGCRPRVAPLPLDADPDPPPRVVPHDEPRPTVASRSFSEEDLPEMAATTPPPTETPEPAVGGAANGPATGAIPPATGQPTPATSALPSPLDTIRPDTPPNVAAATRLADAARVRLAAGDDAAALEQLERAIAIDPTNPYAYFFLAQVHFRTRSYDQAIAFADRAAALSAGTSPEWTCRARVLQGNAYEAAGRFADARQAYLRAAQASPGNPAALAGLARTSGGSPP
ncbi:tetratricopeptide repeat protein [bacterium]|nr:tetratricopeptide repeat protein [bacterium]